MVSEQDDGEFVRERDKSEASRQPGPTLEDVAFQFPNAESAMDVRISKSLAKFEQGHHRTDFVSVGQRAQLLLDGGG